MPNEPQQIMIKRLLLIGLPLLGNCLIQAQPLNKATYNTMIETAEELFAQKDWYNALEWYEKAYEERRDYDVAIRIAEINFRLRDYRRASSWYARAFRRDKTGKYNEYRFNYARALKMQGKYPEAIKEFGKYLQTATDPVKRQLAEVEKQGCEWALQATEVPNVTISNAGRNVNTKQSEYAPWPAPDGETMYYASFRTDEVIILDEKNHDEAVVKIMRAHKTDKGWSKPEELSPQINRPAVHTSNVALSPDGRRMYFTRQELQGNELAQSRIYVSEWSGNDWGPAREVQGVNGEWIATHPAVGELFGKEVLYFASDMDGGYGGLDIYYATYKGDGIYGDPVNLGPKINTVGNEVTPFYQDGVLYFSSDGHPGLGGLDIFFSEWNGTIWSTPQNMGKGFNSSVDDLYFRLHKDGTWGFLTSNRPATGARSLKSKTCCDDIYNVSLKIITANLIAAVVDAETKIPLKGATVQVIDPSGQSEQPTQSLTNAESNTFSFPLEVDRSYLVIGTHPDYFPDTLTLNTVGLLDDRTFELTLDLAPKPVYVTIKREEPFVLQNIYYDFDKADIKPEAEKDLKFILELMQQYPDMVIELSSHTDARGDDAYNRALSQRRAEAARRWLIEHGIERRRIRAVGYGETQPKVVNAELARQYPFLKEGDVLTEDFINKLETEEQREIAHQLNRRTEFKIISGPKSIQIEEKKLIRLGVREVKDTTVQIIKKPKGSDESGSTTAPSKIHKMSSLYGKNISSDVPIMDFEQRIIDLGPVKKGEKRTFTYKFTNRGNVPLIIDLISSCDCTHVTYEQGPYPPGASGVLKVTFDSSEKDESEEVTIDIILKNEEPGTHIPIIEQLAYRFTLVK